ncbi:MAG: DUF1329 domain-containing protein [Cycloclasticus sp.]
MKIVFVVSVLLCLSFNTIASEPPAAGTIIDTLNVSRFEEYLSQPVIDLIKEDAFTITIGENFDIPISTFFLEKTKEFKGLARIDASSGQLLNYHEGLPFTDEPDENDPFAGLKIAWNMRYANAADTSLVDPFIWQYRNMATSKIERTISFVGMTLRYKHRTNLAPIPNLPNNPSNIFNAIYLLAEEPFDLKNTQLLVHRLEDDTARERTWLYLSVQRRVRSLPAGQTTDAFLGSDIMIEDFLGYNGRIKDMTWRFLATRDLLTPVYKHKQMEPGNGQSKIDYDFGRFHGKGNCFPDVPWQLRKTYVLEAKPNSNEHPLSKRIFYVDAQTHIPLAGQYYDRNGKIWRIAISGFTHPDFHLAQNKDSGVAIPTLISMIDLQAQHCTTLKMKTLINSTKIKRKNFSVQSLRSRGK